MLMFVSILLAGVLVLAVCAAILGIDRRPDEPVAEMRLSAEPARFFAGETARPLAQADHVALQMLLRQIERHVRLEQAAAESFIDVPTLESLHAKSASPFVN
jgi:hypothetical protein